MKGLGWDSTIIWEIYNRDMRPIERIRNILRYFDLESELEDNDVVHEEILKGIVFKGTNLWILGFAIIVASVGLNMNSTAVIIGAMLISPLMGPINGMGYSIATYNFELFKQSVKNFTFAVGTSLVASTTYFALSPISTAHSELLARTSPTIYDVLIALFGGLAGIVAISSKQKGNVIPGVAIATALMPPLCTAGYGLATAQFDFFFGAIYLFTINTVFIALASVAVSQFLKFPIRTLISPGQKKRVNQWISLVIALVLIPSIYFGYGLVQKERFNENAGKYIANISMFEGNYLLTSDINPDRKEIALVYGGMDLSEGQKQTIISRKSDFNLHKAVVTVKQGLSFDSKGTQNQELLRLREELIMLNQALKEKELVIDSLRRKEMIGEALLKEAEALFPQVDGCTYFDSWLYETGKPGEPVKTSLVLFTLKENGLPEAEKEKVRAWIKARLGDPGARIIFE